MTKKRTAAEEFDETIRRVRRANSWVTIEPHPPARDEQTRRFNEFLMDDLRRARRKHF